MENGIELENQDADVNIQMKEESCAYDGICADKLKMGNTCVLHKAIHLCGSLSANICLGENKISVASNNAHGEKRCKMTPNHILKYNHVKCKNPQKFKEKSVEENPIKNSLDLLVEQNCFVPHSIFNKEVDKKSVSEFSVSHLVGLVNPPLSSSNGKCFTCEICKKSFKQKNVLKKHYLCHCDKKPFACDICNKNFKRNCELKQHTLCLSDSRKFVCEICYHSFKQLRVLKEHMLCHSDGKPYVCDICKKSFKRKYHLKNHMQCHSESKPFICDICQKSFKTKRVYRDHMLCHSELKPFSCKLCGKKFKRKDALKDHMICHSDLRPFICSICQKAFKRKAHLKDHIVSHTIYMQREGKVIVPHPAHANNANIPITLSNC